ncbi:uncharacterized protein LOC142169121 [Nicotiana tabacum]|uniref:Uncharacterized protein LOC142169121 n=1 Tax=Nicotiana tabacum TaxID=4097 RepID=A0AC58SNA7_TOBAC
MITMERFFLITFFLLSYFVCTILFLIDGVVVKHEYQWISKTIGIIMLGFLFWVAPLYDFLRVNFLDGPAIQQRFAKLCNPVGPLMSIFVAYALDGRKGDSVGPYLYWLLLAAPICSFFAIILLRPVATDFGAFYPLCAILVNFSIKEYGKHSFETYLTVGICVVLMILRAILESYTVWTTADRNQAKRVAANQAAAAASTAAADTAAAAAASAVTSSEHEA